ncbi:JAB domain-containing protein [Pseudomonas aeruginosa]|nr:JAB domain-containing protein [Pseudomonas aeruginosa]WRH54827.1 JAB domain-containing protein [Pseudomonas aeruginosa]
MSQLSFPSFDSCLLVRDAHGRYLPASADDILEAARQVIDRKMRRGAEFTSPAAVKEYLRTKLASFEHEVFVVLFMDTRHRLIEYREMFHGTIDGASVYPREVVKEALRLNAAAVVVAHFVARHKMRILCPVFLCAVLGGQERTSWASGQNRGT